ncbi:VOC family protein [Rheinheimera riviphila]|uniref:VOC family protein n=1 Tax=Rheinheimera riviphila TaxID=1834037 RepID=A0A437QZR0_9GAMM|nr:VOC family protein [Rheinheimera riviphila]RVU39943.1 VOC family protein [Rheinheimera riviphila]
MSLPDQINYLELPSLNPQASKDFFTALFGWRFEDYGPDYIAFFGAGIDGGFYRSNIVATPAQGGTLVVLKSANLAQSLAEVTAIGATIVKPIFSFPGGHRFEFLEPGGNQLAIWAE